MSEILSEVTNEVLEISKINFEGNIIPHNWYSQITRPNGKPDLNAITILSEIIFYYRGIAVKDETTGNFEGYKKRFKGNMLQRSYKSFENQFGLSREQIKRSLVRLEQMGLIERVFKNLQLDNGSKLTNVMYLKIYPEKIKEITFKKHVEDEVKKNTEKTGNAHTSVQKYTEVGAKIHVGYVQKHTEGMCKNARTNTKSIITENTITENNTTTGGAKNDFAPKTNRKDSKQDLNSSLNERKREAKEVYRYYAKNNKESDKSRNKERALKNISKLLLEYSAADLKKAAENYSETRIAKHIHEQKYIKDPANFYGQRKDSRYFQDFLPERFEKLKETLFLNSEEREFERIKQNLIEKYSDAGV